MYVIYNDNECVCKCDGVVRYNISRIEKLEIHTKRCGCNGHFGSLRVTSATNIYHLDKVSKSCLVVLKENLVLMLMPYSCI